MRKIRPSPHCRKRETAREPVPIQEALRSYLKSRGWWPPESAGRPRESPDEEREAA